MSKLQEREAKRKSTVAGMVGVRKTELTRGGMAEKKKRYCLALKPSLYEAVQDIAYVQRKSMSQVVDELLEGYLRANDGVAEGVHRDAR